MRDDSDLRIRPVVGSAREQVPRGSGGYRVPCGHGGVRCDPTHHARIPDAPHAPKSRARDVRRRPPKGERLDVYGTRGLVARHGLMLATARASTGGTNAMSRSTTHASATQIGVSTMHLLMVIARTSHSCRISLLHQGGGLLSPPSSYHFNAEGLFENCHIEPRLLQNSPLGITPRTHRQIASDAYISAPVRLGAGIELRHERRHLNA